MELEPQAESGAFLEDEVLAAIGPRFADAIDLERYRPIFGHSGVDTRYQARTSGPETPMVGRERELNRLRRAFAASRRGEGQSVSIVSAPGVGKTRLV